MIAVAPLLARYGPLAILLGAGIEGEAVVVTGGAVAASGLFHPLAAGLAAFVGSACADQLLFLAGRRGRDSRLVARVRARPGFARVLGWIEARPVPFVLAFRFVYGLRTVGPVALGVSHVPARRFVPLNLLSAAVWASLFTWLGWRFGPLLQPLVARLAPHLAGIAAGAAGVVLVVLLVRRQSRQS